MIVTIILPNEFCGRCEGCDDLIYEIAYNYAICALLDKEFILRVVFIDPERYDEDLNNGEGRW